MFYEITAKITAPDDKGLPKTTKPQFITDADLFCEAEAKTIQQYGTAGNTQLDVTAIKRSAIREIVNTKSRLADSFSYRATLVETFTDESTAEEKEQKYHVLVWAASLTEANDRIQQYMKQGLQDLKLDAIVKTRIIELLP